VKYSVNYKNKHIIYQMLKI